MLTLKKPTVSLFADKSHQRWVVRDPEGDFWILPPTEHPWDHREPFDLTGEEIELEPVPGHYKYMLDLPF